MSDRAIVPAHGRRRPVIERVTPIVDDGRFAVKRIAGDVVTVEADILADSHDELSAWLLYRRDAERRWRQAPLQPLVNDRWRGEFHVGEPGRYRYTVTAWVDAFATWRRDLQKRVAAGQDLALQFLIGAGLIEATAARIRGAEARRLGQWSRQLRDDGDEASKLDAALSGDLAALMERNPDKDFIVRLDKELPIVVDRERARFSTWYEFFPRSCGEGFEAATRRLPYIAGMGFDVVYLPPIHPIGYTYRKGKNNNPAAEAGEPGSPWAIGSEAGGHKAVDPELGTLDEFHAFVAQTEKHGLEVALDIAFQCSPDHPWVKGHPQWFRHRPDGTVQYAENPPKKYQDIYPLDFETEDWQALWEELKSVFLFWIEQGVRIFRVDNPHTKPFRFWEWLIGEIKRDHPNVLFLAEAFTRPKVMHYLAKLGFSQSYTYFTWRNTRAELTEYFTELAQTESRNYFRPNVWPNTPDILHEYLQTGGRPAFMIRLILAGTLSANYGIYGPAFELGENLPRDPGSEEYLNSEKYQRREWDIDRPDSLRALIARVNAIRKQNRALQNDWWLQFHGSDNDQLIVYSKTAEDLDNVIVTVVNLDPFNPQAGWLYLSPDAVGVEPDKSFVMHDLLTGARYTWQGTHHYVALDPHTQPAHVFRVER